ncbi:MAG: T9SS type A sorting domain-containing protein [Bacteroidales bacterium]|nr:T9SS type A sorting domain-containing protein [Bacteroidales bacterium]MCF8336770.1 T9SS type A sorting domain-containing protein [Bacteroidales bacterium]
MKRSILFMMALLFISTQIMQAQDYRFVRQHGTENADYGKSITHDREGNMYVIGTFSDADMEMGDVTTLNNAGGKDIFIARYDAEGNIDWAFSTDGDADDFGEDIICHEDRLYITGYFESTTLDFPDHDTDPSNDGNKDLFVAAIEKSTGDVLWTETSYDGTNNEMSTSLTYNDGNVYIAGHYDNAFNFGGSDLTYQGGKDVFVAKFSTDGSPDGYYTLSGYEDEYGYGIAANPSAGKIYITGHFNSSTLSNESSDIIVTNSSPGTFDIFLVELTSDLSAYTNYNSPDGYNSEPADEALNDMSYDVVAGPTGAIYITGSFESETLEIPAAPDDMVSHHTITNTNRGYTNYYLVKYASPATPPMHAEWMRTASNTEDERFNDRGTALALDRAGHCYVAGFTRAWWINFPRVGSFENSTNNNYEEIFFTAYTGDGDNFEVKVPQEIDHDAPLGIDVCGRFFSATGYFGDLSDISFGSTSLTSNGETDVFVTKGILNFALFRNASDSLITGVTPIGEVDTTWELVDSPGDYTDAITCVWNEESWSYGEPLPGTNYISVDNPPIASMGTYIFEREFHLDSVLQAPVLELYTFVDDSATLFLNGEQIGSAHSYNASSLVQVDNPQLFNVGKNTLQVHVHNTIPGMMAFDLKGFFYNNSNACDKLHVSKTPVDTSECCYNVHVNNTMSWVDFQIVDIETASGDRNINSISPTGGGGSTTWNISAPHWPTEQATVRNTSGTLPNNYILNMCFEESEAIDFDFLGFNQNGDTILCEKSLQFECQDDSCQCEQCEVPVKMIKTGNGLPSWGVDTRWDVVSNPWSGPVVDAEFKPTAPGWGAPISHTRWITCPNEGVYSEYYPEEPYFSYPVFHPPLSTGWYTYEYDFTITEDDLVNTCPEADTLDLKVCIMVDDSAVVNLNGVEASATNQRNAQVFTMSRCVSRGSNTLSVKVRNNPAVVTGFDMKAWVCCPQTNAIPENNQANSLHIYPVPASEWLTVTSEQKIESIRLFNNMGKCVKAKEVGNYEETLNVDHLPKGMYIIRTKAKERIFNKKIIIE